MRETLRNSIFKVIFYIKIYYYLSSSPALVPLYLPSTVFVLFVSGQMSPDPWNKIKFLSHSQIERERQREGDRQKDKVKDWNWIERDRDERKKRQEERMGNKGIRQT